MPDGRSGKDFFCEREKNGENKSIGLSHCFHFLATNHFHATVSNKNILRVRWHTSEVQVFDNCEKLNKVAAEKTLSVSGGESSRKLLFKPQRVRLSAARDLVRQFQRRRSLPASSPMAGNQGQRCHPGDCVSPRRTHWTSNFVV